MRDYHAGRLDPGRMRELHAHFKVCEACRTKLRLGRAAAGAAREREREPGGLASPELQAQIARNRDLLIKVFLLMVFAWLVWKLKR